MRKSSLERDQQLATIAKAHILPGTSSSIEGNASIGHSFYFPGEQIVDQWLETLTIGTEVENVFVTVTTTRDAQGLVSGHRLLLSYDRNAHVTYGGAFVVKQGKNFCINSVYVVPAYRHGDVGEAVARVLRDKMQVKCALEPMSTQGKAWVKRYGFTPRKAK